MKLWNSLIFVLITGTAHSEPAVQVIGIEGRPSDTPVIHLLGGQRAELALQISSTTPGRGSVHANLYQLATGVAAPIAKGLPVGENLVLDGSSIRPHTFAMTPPEVRGATMMELRFASKPEVGEIWQPAGTARLVVHPADIFTQIKTQLSAATSRAGVRLAVLGESPQLKQVLGEAGLMFEESDTSSFAEGRTLYSTECSAEAARALVERVPATARLLVFTRDPLLPPGVYWTERGTGFTAKVTLPIFADFARAPERQLILLNLFQKAFDAFSSSP